MNIVAQRVPKLTKREEEIAYEIVTLRDKNTCQKCKRNCGPIARDHRQNRQGNNTVPSNLQCLGLACHQWKTEHPTQAIEEGWAVPRWADPLVWPARRWVPSGIGTLTALWVLYDNRGYWHPITAEEAERRMAGVD